MCLLGVNFFMKYNEGNCDPQHKCHHAGTPLEALICATSCRSRPPKTIYVHAYSESPRLQRVARKMKGNMISKSQDTEKHTDTRKIIASRMKSETRIVVPRATQTTSCKP